MHKLMLHGAKTNIFVKRFSYCIGAKLSYIYSLKYCYSSPCK